MIVMPNPLPIPLIEFQKAKREKIIIAIGRLSKVKGFDKLINIF